MDTTDLPDTTEEMRRDIAALEERIETLGDQLARAHKIAFAAKAAIIAGAIWLAAVLLGIIYTDGLTLMIATILILGGIVLSGSNATTAGETQAAIAKAERERAALIGEIELTLVANDSHLLN